MDKLANLPKGQPDLLAGGKIKNISCGLKLWHEQFSRTQSSRRRLYMYQYSLKRFTMDMIKHFAN